MSNNRKDFILTKLAEKYTFVNDLDLYKFYQKIDELYEKVETTKPKDTSIFSGIGDPDVISFLIKLSNFWKSLVKEDFSGNSIANSKVKHCIYLKYWLYDKLIINGFNEYDANMIFDFLKKNKNGYTTAVISGKTCNFYKLSLKDSYDIKKLYDYSELLYDADIKIYDDIAKENKYRTYFKNGLDLYSSSKVICFGNQNEYCHEFNEYAKIRNKDQTKTDLLSCKEKVLSSLNKNDTSVTEESIKKGEIPSYTLDLHLKELLKKDQIDDKLPIHKYYELLTNKHKTNNRNGCDSSKNKHIIENPDLCKLLGSVKNILESWDPYFSSHEKLDSNKLCTYFNYWLYDKLRFIQSHPCDFDTFYFLWNEFALEKSKKGKTCLNKNYYGFNIQQLENKTKLFHFLEYYGNIRDKLKEDNNNYKKDYCYYIQSMFELYKAMVYNNISNAYSEELWLFKKMFWGNNEVLFLEKKCPNMCLDLVFNVKYKTLCPLDEKPSILDEKIDLNICEIEQVSNVNQSFEENNEKEYIFQDLNTSTVYNKLNSEIITDNYYRFCSKLLPFSSKHCGIYGLCVKLARNIKDLSYMKNKERTDRCEYIIHWMFDKIRKILKMDTNSIYDTNVLSEFFKVGYNIFHKFGVSDCLYNTINVNFEEQKEKKHLHDYFKDFDKINCYNATNSTKCEKHCEYITHINGLYGKHFGNCCYCFKSGGCMNMCPDYFRCEDTYNPHNLFETLKCKSIEKYSGAMQKIQKPLFADHYVTWLTEHFEKEKEKPLLKLEEKEFSITPKVESSSTPEKVCDKITCDPFNVAALGSFGFMGFLLLSFIFYKFTPLGYYFHNKDARNKKSYFQRSEEQFLEDDFEFNHSSMKNRRMRLAYHQA
ncbi:PIR Superfamily Protein [Plasmodium ovale curtisi]|uniref:PIR Superfamily Protein n=1 Tax=Plasmodium ovale curtisi TaxID=864141 RepID=A0A1A8X5B0_PLAOA|nr:PIR Superfamily Protein [Plasmodium ovale curtisi]